MEYNNFLEVESKDIISRPKLYQLFRTAFYRYYDNHTKPPSLSDKIFKIWLDDNNMFDDCYFYFKFIIKWFHTNNSSAILSCTIVGPKFHKDSYKESEIEISQVTSIDFKTYDTLFINDFWESTSDFFTSLAENKEGAK